MQTLRCQAKRISGDRNEQRISRNEWLWLIHLLQNVTDRQTLRNINWTNDTVLNKTSVKQEITIIIVRLAPFQWFQLRLMPITSTVVSGWPLYSHDQIPRLFRYIPYMYRTFCVTYDGLFAHVTKQKCFQTQLASCRDASFLLSDFMWCTTLPTK